MMTAKVLKNLLGDRTRWRAAKQHEYYERDEHTREWLDYCEKINLKGIDDCIAILEKLHSEYDKYYERTALQNAIRHLELYRKY